MPRKPLSGPTTLQVWKGETVSQHRALLLWAMQRPEERSTRAVGRAVGKTESTVRGWRKRLKWAERTSGHSEPERVALDLYRAEYMKDFGQIDLIHVSEHVAIPLAADSEEERETSPEANAAVDEVDRRLAEDRVRRRNTRSETRNKHLDLLDILMGYGVSALKEGNLRLNASDLLKVMTLREAMLGVDAPEPSKRVIIESERVRQAKANDGDVIEAMYEDLLEMKAIIGALRTKRDQREEQDEPRGVVVKLPIEGDAAEVK